MSKVDITDNALTSKDGEILRLLNQIASDIVKRSDVDEIVKCQSLRLQGGPFSKRLQPKPYNRQFHAASMAETVMIHVKYI